MDAATAQKHGFHVGNQVRVLFGSGVHTFTISGIAQYGGADTLAGVTVAAFALPTAQQLLNRVGEFNTINIVTQPGADQATVEHAIARALPPGIEVVSGQTVRNEQTNSINAALSFFSTTLVIFALIALFVGAFTIFNTFSITVSQRTRELALLGIVGASRRQGFRSVLAEAAIVGALASLVGIGLACSRPSASRRCCAVSASRCRRARSYSRPGQLPSVWSSGSREDGLRARPGAPRRADPPGRCSQGMPGATGRLAPPAHHPG